MLLRQAILVIMLRSFLIFPRPIREQAMHPSLLHLAPAPQLTPLAQQTAPTIPICRKGRGCRTSSLLLTRITLAEVKDGPTPCSLATATLPDMVTESRALLGRIVQAPPIMVLEASCLRTVLSLTMALVGQRLLLSRIRRINLVCRPALVPLQQLLPTALSRLVRAL